MTKHELRPARVAFVSLVGLFILLRLTGVIRVVVGVDVAVFVALIGGIGIYYDAFVGLFRRRISADLAVSIAALAALYIGESLAAAEVIFIMLVGEICPASVLRQDKVMFRRICMFPGFLESFPQ